jgi:hypothetical protein
VSDDTPPDTFPHVHTDEEQRQLAASLAAVHTTRSAIRAGLVQMAAAGDAEAAQGLARGDAQYQE